MHDGQIFVQVYAALAASAPVYAYPGAGNGYQGQSYWQVAFYKMHAIKALPAPHFSEQQLA